MIALIITLIIIIFIWYQLHLAKKRLNLTERLCFMGNIDNKNIKKVEEIVGKATKVISVEDGYIYRWQIVGIFTQYQVSLFCDKDYNCKNVIMDYNK